MSVFTRLASLWRTKSPSPTDDFWFTGLGAKSATGIMVNQMVALQASTAMACASIRAIDVAKLPAHVYKLDAKGGKVIQPNHALEWLLQKPNPWQTRLEFFEQMQVAYLLEGNAYAVIRRDGRGRPIALIPVNPDRVCIYEAPGGEILYRVTRTGYHEQAVLAGFPDLIHDDDMLHLRWMSRDSLSGLSRISLAREPIALHLALEQLAASNAGSGARPGGVLQTDKKLTKEVLDRLKAQFDANYSGMTRAGKTAVLEEGLKWERQTMTFVDAEFSKQRDHQIEEIARAFDVPPHRLGIIPEGGGQAIIQANQFYINNTVASDVERWEAKLDDTFGLSDAGLFVEFDVDRFNRADIQTRLNALGTAVTRSIYTVNEARRKEGLPDDPKGNIILQPANVVPLGTIPAPNTNPSGPGSDITGAPAPGGDGDPAAVPDPDGE